MTIPFAPTPAPVPNVEPGMTTDLPPNPPPRRRRGGLPVWAWVTIAVGTVVTLLVGGLVVVGLMAMDSYLVHDLLHEDFSRSQGAFATGEFEGHTYEVRDGTYVITPISEDAGPAYAYGTLARPAAALAAIADVSAEAGTVVGIGCATELGRDGYYLLMNSDGTVGALVRMGVDAGGLTDLGMSDVRFGGPVSSIRLDCVRQAVTGVVELSGYVNGELIVTATDRGVTDLFSTVVLTYSSQDTGEPATFDNIDVTVERPPASPAPTP